MLNRISQTYQPDRNIGSSFCEAIKLKLNPTIYKLGTSVFYYFLDILLVIINWLTQKHYFDYGMKTLVYRWEANQIPRVKVAKIYSSAARNEQTPYMPDIPDIPKCLPDLRASKQWEDTFITQFAETRMVSYLV